MPLNAQRAITAGARRTRRWWSRPRTRHPQWATDCAHPHAYDLPTARQLLTHTAELPASKRGLLVVLTEYRHALHAMTLLAETSQQSHHDPAQ